MNIQAKLTLLVSGDAVTIEVHDAAAAVRFLTLELTPEQFCAVLGRLAMVPCQSAKVTGLDLVGKSHECKNFEFPLPAGVKWRDKEAATTEVQRVCPDGWEPDLYFSSQDSFFDREGQRWARTMIRRWVERDAGETEATA